MIIERAMDDDCKQFAAKGCKNLYEHFSQIWT